MNLLYVSGSEKEGGYFNNNNFDVVIDSVSGPEFIELVAQVSHFFKTPPRYRFPHANEPPRIISNDRQTVDTEVMFSHLVEDILVDYADSFYMYFSSTIENVVKNVTDNKKHKGCIIPFNHESPIPYSKNKNFIYVAGEFDHGLHFLSSLEGLVDTSNTYFYPGTSNFIHRLMMFHYKEAMKGEK